jgi:hypothetical protein
MNPAIPTSKKTMPTAIAAFCSEVRDIVAVVSLPVAVMPLSLVDH